MSVVRDDHTGTILAVGSIGSAVVGEVDLLGLSIALAGICGTDTCLGTLVWESAGTSVGENTVEFIADAGAVFASQIVFAGAGVVYEGTLTCVHLAGAITATVKLAAAGNRAALVQRGYASAVRAIKGAVGALAVGLRVVD